MVGSKIASRLLAAGALFAISIPVVHAQLIDNGNFTTDPATGLEWLDLTETQGMSYNQVLASSFVTNDGYQFATDSQVTTLLLNAGFTAVDANWRESDAPAADLLLALMGCTLTCTGFTPAGQGFSDFDVFSATEANTPYYQTGGPPPQGRAFVEAFGNFARDKDTPDANIGAFLVRQGPLPMDDGDGIADAIDGTFNGGFNDQSAVFSNDFTDQHLDGGTFGSIVDRSDHIVAVNDDSTPNPVPPPVQLGVILEANGGTGTAQVQTCTGPVVNTWLTDGDQFRVTCGSFTGETLANSVIVTFGTNISVTIPAGAIAFIEELPGSILSISHLGQTGDPDIVVDNDGDVTNLGPDDPPVMTIPDADDDGVADDVDLCLDTTPGANVDVNGCADLQVDADGDGVCDPEAASVGPSGCGSSDVCADTAIPESVPTRSLRRNRYALTGDPDNMTFESTHRKVITTSDTGGCSCEQVIDALGLGQGQTWYGCSRSAMLGWIDQVSP